MGFPLGLCFVVAAYLALREWGPGLYFWFNAAIQALLASSLGLLSFLRARQHEKGLSTTDIAREWLSLSLAWRWALGLTAAWLAVRWLGAVVEVVNRPLFPWDAWSGYAVEAKLWFFNPEARTTIFATPFFQGQEIWMAGNKHPPGIALIQLWVLQALGRWDDALMNIAWPVGMLSLGILLFGLLRLFGSDLCVSAVTTALVLTSPMLNTHVALAGYGDIWVGILLLVAVGAVMQAVGHNQLTLLLLSACAAVSLLVIKVSSLVWAPVIMLGLLFGLLSFSQSIIVLVSLFVAGSAALWVYGHPIYIPNIGHMGFSEGSVVWPRMPESGDVFNMDAVVSVFQQLFLVDNWHFFWYLALPLCVASSFHVRNDRILRVLLVVVAIGAGIVIVVFTMTTMSDHAVDATRVNRVFLHLAPLFGLLGGLVVSRWKFPWPLKVPGYDHAS